MCPNICKLNRKLSSWMFKFVNHQMSVICARHRNFTSCSYNLWNFPIFSVEINLDHILVKFSIKVIVRRKWLHCHVFTYHSYYEAEGYPCSNCIFLLAGWMWTCLPLKGIPVVCLADEVRWTDVSMDTYIYKYVVLTDWI